MRHIRGLLPFCLLVPAFAPGLRGQTPAPATVSNGVYEHVFRHVLFLKQTDDDLAAKGVPNANNRSYYKKQAQLTQAQADTLETVARDCTRDLAALDGKAAAIIRAARARLAGQKLMPGEKTPAPPAELAAMQKERAAVVAAARARLRQSLGADFSRFESYLGERFRPGKTKAAPAAPANTGVNR